MTWDYTFAIVRGGGSEDDLRVIKDHGQQGWEAFACLMYTFERHWFFKRQSKK
jgi:hypothetical protein